MIGIGLRASCIAAVVAVAYLMVGALTAPAFQHRVHLRLIPESTSWPWHSSIQRASVAWINSPERQRTGGTSTVRALPPENIEDLYILATGEAGEPVREVADDTAARFLEHDADLQAEPVRVRIQAYQAELQRLGTEFLEQEQSVQRASTPTEITVRSTVLEGTAELISELRGQLGDLEDELAGQTARYEVVSSEPINRFTERIPEAVRLFAGLGFILFLVGVARAEGRLVPLGQRRDQAPSGAEAFVS